MNARVFALRVDLMEPFVHSVRRYEEFCYFLCGDSWSLTLEFYIGYDFARYNISAT